MELNKSNGFDVTVLILETDNIDLPLLIRNMINNLFEDITGDDDEVTRSYISMDEFPKKLKEFFFLENQKSKYNFFIKSLKMNEKNVVIMETQIGDNKKEDIADFILKTHSEPYYDVNTNTYGES